MKRRPILLSALLGLVAFPIAAQRPSDPSSPPGRQFQYSYAAKFVCGESSEEFEEGVVRGVYATAINVHNPSLRERVGFVKKIARALPWQMAGTVTPFEQASLEANHAFEVECNEIRKRLPGSTKREFRTGFLVILSPRELDVTAVYTSRPVEGEVASIDVEVIRPRELDRRTPSDLPDLTVRDIRLDTLRVDCPQGPGSCVTTVEVVIGNIGSADAGAFTTRSVLDPSQSVVVDRPSPAGLAAGADDPFTVQTPPGGGCFDPDCTICVTVDHAGAVAESDETNNQLCRTREG